MNKTNTGANTNTLHIILDFVATMVAFCAGYFIFGRDLASEQVLFFFVVCLVYSAILILANKEQYLYNVTLFFYIDRVLKKVTGSVLLATICTSALMFYVPEAVEIHNCYFAYVVIVYCLSCLRLFFGKRISRFMQRDALPRTVFVGKIGEFNKFRYFLEKTNVQIEVLGYIALRDEHIDEAKEGAYLGCMKDLEHLVRTHNIDQVYIIQKQGTELAEIQGYVDTCIAMGVTVRIIVDFYKRRRANSYVSSIGTYPVITYHTITLNSYERVIKRAADIVGSLIGIILSSPIMLVTAIAIKLDSKGPVMFKQTRVGQNGRHFKIYKFRSMYLDAEERKKELMAQNEIEGGVMFKMKDDPRITRVGKIIRKLSIDELPQFFNVFIGNMSLVGTRPPTLDEVEKYKTNHWRRISIKPGITGMWQVSGRSDIQNFEDIVELDVEYIDRWNLMLDIKIIFKTVWVIFAHKGAC